MQRRGTKGVGKLFTYFQPCDSRNEYKKKNPSAFSSINGNKILKNLFDVISNCILKTHKVRKGEREDGESKRNKVNGKEIRNEILELKLLFTFCFVFLVYAALEYQRR